MSEDKGQGLHEVRVHPDGGSTLVWVCPGPGSGFRAGRGEGSLEAEVANQELGNVQLTYDLQSAGS